MKDFELYYLTQKKKAYDEIISEIYTIVADHKKQSTYAKALYEIIHSLRSQRKMVEFAIYNREKKT